VKITTNRRTLADAVAWVAQVVPRNPNQPALAGIRLRAEHNTLTISGFDYDVSHEARIAVEVTDDGECLISGAFLRAFTNAMTGKDITLQAGDGAASITSGRSTYRTQCMPLADYPKLPTAPEGLGKTDGTQLATAIAAACGAVDDDTPHDSFRGLRLEVDGNALELVGLDGKLMVHHRVAWEGELFAVTTPGGPIAKAVRGLAGAVAIGASGSALSLSDAERTVVLRVNEAKYVNWRAAHRPAADDRFGVIVDRDALLEAVKRAALLTKSGDVPSPMTLSIEPDSIEVTTADDVAGGSEVLEVEGDGSEVICLNPTYLQQALTAMQSVPVRLGIAHRTNPDMGGLMTVRPANQDDQDGREAAFAPRRGGEAR
jgi:DNA polymerase-3 subunit beta